jgi:hypothetical protein
MVSPMIESRLRVPCVRVSTGGADEAAIHASLAVATGGTVITRWTTDHGMA